MKSLLLLITICISSVSFGQVPEFPKFKKIDAIDVSTDLKTRVKHVDEVFDKLSLDSKYSGKIKADFYRAKQKSINLNLLCEFKNGKLNGSQYLIKNNRIEVSNYLDGIVDGIQESYREKNGGFYLSRSKRYENGNLVWEFRRSDREKFTTSTNLKNGKKNGLQIETYENESICYVWNFEDDSYTGIQKVFNSDSVLLSEVNLNNGNGILEVERTDDNQKIEFINGKINSERLFYKNGKEKSIKTYDYHHPNHTLYIIKSWYANGQIKRDDSLSKKWYENGQLKYESDDSLSKEWYENGQLKSESDYVISLSKEWYENGQLKNESVKGEMIEYKINGRKKKKHHYGRL